MAAQKIELDPNWRFAGKLLPVETVMVITTFSYDTILRLKKAGTLIPSLNKRPYRFDPEHIYQVFFGPQKVVLNDSVRSLKTEKRDFVGHKPVKKEDLWHE